MAAASFELERGGAKFELTTSEAGGSDLPLFSLQYIDCFKKGLALHMILGVVHDLVLTLQCQGYAVQVNVFQGGINNVPRYVIHRCTSWLP